MGITLVVVSFTAAIFFAMILNLAAKPKFTAQVTGILLATATLGGLLLYGYGFAMTLDNPFLATIRALLAVCGMFVGKNELSAIASAPGMHHDLLVFLFWMIHTFALYTTASAAITTIGAEALKKLRLLLSRRGDLVLIFGNNLKGFAIGTEYGKMEHTSVVYVASAPGAAYQAEIAKSGAALRIDGAALSPNQAFLRSLGISANTERNIYLYALDEDHGLDLNYALKFLEALNEMGVDSKKTHVTLPGTEDALVSCLQTDKNNKRYGFVNIFEEAERMARVMVKKCPPWQSISFDENGKATENFEALIIGFGRMGQAVLKSLVMNGQFEGSHFHAVVASRDCKETSGYIRKECPEMFTEYDIDFMDADGRSTEIFEYIEKNISVLKYVAICVGDGKTANEIKDQLMSYAEKHGANPKVVICSPTSVRTQESLHEPADEWTLYSLEALDNYQLDRRAMILNYSYVKNSSTPEEEDQPWHAWLECDSFGRKSSRASADFFDAMITAAHSTEEEILKDGWELSEEQQENLGRTEHLRWCAFHHCMGFSCMSKEEFQARTEQYLKEKRELGAGKTRIGKNLAGKTHACLIPWEELDELSATENSITGGSVDYKKMDVNNVLAIPELLKVTER